MTKIFIQWVLIEIVDSLHLLLVYDKQETNLEVLEKMSPHAKVITWSGEWEFLLLMSSNNSGFDD